jgi:hypothetical protein
MTIYVLKEKHFSSRFHYSSYEPPWIIRGYTFSLDFARKWEYAADDTHEREYDDAEEIKEIKEI